MIRYYHSSFFNDDLSLHENVNDFGESVVDKSFFRPDSVTTRADMANITGSAFKGSYDFADGKDNGSRAMTMVAQKGLDITELDNALKSVQSTVNAKKAKDKEMLNQVIDEAKSKQSSNISDTSDSTQ